ncbi:MAG: amino acid ABC transporter substrate-binding protein [Rhabdochlamydiaceae bacterium]|nr:amino acid ABC transporter substrate-binding protein [Rhabdochlamydiaceae bacterium]
MTICRLAFLCLLLFASCGKKSSGYDFKVALDPAWYSFEIPGRENALTAFSTELIEAIGKEENLKIGVYTRSWSNLMLGLQENDYQAICTPMQPYIFFEKLYVFSSVYLETGPVLIGLANSSWNALSQLEGQEVGILQGSTNALILEKFPSILQRTYSSIQSGLDDVKNNVIQAMILDILTAEAYTKDLYAGQLKISSPPLTPEGIRLVGLKGKSEELVRRFNRGLARLKSNGTYSKIAQKWGLSEAK